MSVILWFIVIYFLFRFIFKFVLPVISATRTVRSKVDDMRQNMEGYQTTSTSADSSSINGGSSSYNKAGSRPSDSKGDYIDFEEIK